MGKAGVAVFWEEDLNDWANPALLGYQRGIRYSYGRTQLIPELADNVYFTSDRFAIGAYGVGLSIVGKPIEGLGGLRLDYGENVATDEDGNVIGVFRSFEEVNQIGIGVNVLQTLENFVRATGSEPSSLSRYADLSVGHTWKDISVDFGPFGRGEGTEKDWGALARITPIGAGRQDPVKVDLSLGFSRRNYDDSRIVYEPPLGSDPIVEERLFGGATRLLLYLPVAESVIWDFLKPNVGFGVTWEEASYHDGGTRLGGTVQRSGQEISMLGLLSARHGFIDDDAGGVHDDTFGVSVGLQYRGILGVRYDWAQVPQSEILLGKVERNGVTAYFDPFRLYRLTRRSSGGW